MQNILVLGNSPKFNKILKDKYANAQFDIIGWRSLNQSCDETKVYNLVFIVGYDFGTFSSEFNSFYKKNVSDVINFLSVKKFEKDRIYYLNTLISKSYTWSRYAYGKSTLCDLLIQNFNHVFEFRCPTIVSSGKVSMRAGYLEQYIANILIKLRIVKVIGLEEISRDFDNLWIKRTSYYQLHGKLIQLARPAFIDKILRVILG